MIMLKKKKLAPTSTSGFTLIELLLYMGLFMGFMVILSALFISTLEVQTDATSISHTDQDSWYVLSRMQYDIYRADAVITPANNGDDSTTLVLDIDGSEITYSLVNDQLSITENSVTAPLVSGEVTTSELTFKRLGNEDGLSSITLHMLLQNAIVSQDKDFDVTLGLRQ